MSENSELRLPVVIVFAGPNGSGESTITQMAMPTIIRIWRSLLCVTIIRNFQMMINSRLHLFRRTSIRCVPVILFFCIQ